jgi:hypothetical protein
MSVVWTVLAVLVGGYLVLASLLYAGQRHLLFPRQHPPLTAADARAAGYMPLRLESHDGLTLTHWYRPGPPGAPLVVAFHGNAGTVADRVPKLAHVPRAGHGLLLVEYRGYGGNPGAPSEESLLADGRAVLDAMRARVGGDTPIVLYGESLGTGVAVGVAATRAVAAVVLDAPFTSIAEVAQRHYWYMPAKWLIRDPFRSIDRIDRIDAPLLVMHGERDHIVPFRFGRQVFAAANEPKTFWSSAEARHIDLMDHGGDRVMLDFLARHVGAPPARGDQAEAGPELAAP